MPNRVAMIGRYDTGLELRRPIDRFMRSEDPYGTLEFVEYGVGRGEIRDDVDAEMIASMLDWLAERFQDALAPRRVRPGADPPPPRAPRDAHQGVPRGPARRHRGPTRGRSMSAGSQRILAVPVTS